VRQENMIVISLTISMNDANKNSMMNEKERIYH
jgi:hypothetical protein